MALLSHFMGFMAKLNIIIVGFRVCKEICTSDLSTGHMETWVLSLWEGYVYLLVCLFSDRILSKINNHLLCL